MEPMLYTVKEVAQILKCNATRVYGLKDAGLLPFLKLGQRVRTADCGGRGRCAGAWRQD